MVMRTSSAAYMRFGFFLGFISASTGALSLVARLLAIPTDVLRSGTSLQHVPLGIRTLVCVVPLVVGLVGGIWGLGICAHIRRGSLKVESFLGSVWHYASTGALAWTVLSLFQFLVGWGGVIFPKELPAMKAGMM